MSSIGWMSLLLGLLVVAFGLLYGVEQWRFAAAVVYFSLCWGLMFLGTGLTFVGNGRYVVSSIGISLCLISVALTANWQFREATLGDAWLWILGVGNGIPILYAAFSMRKRAKRRRDELGTKCQEELPRPNPPT